MRSIEFHPEAEVELISAARYYEDQTENLGLEFVSAVHGAHSEPRRIFIVAVAHLQRRPGYWRSRR